MNHRTACSNNQHLSQKTLLASLPSKINSDKVIIASTGEILDVTDQTQKTINSNLRAKIWLPVEDSLPRKILLYNEDKWTITSYDPKSKTVCVTFTAPTGERQFSFTLS